MTLQRGMPEGNLLAEQLRAAGAPAALIAEAEERDANSDEVVEVLHCNLATVHTYECCQLTYLAGMSGAICTGVSALEVHAALQIRGERREQWQDIGEGVQLMARAAAEIINRKR
ncbi:hypothetical protein [Dyella sp. 20L07]|uniref:hypothetical protein n=1 Tax=Dyella sp. 20L07 TaxID=3384240 RepID=UPI003D2BAE26